MFNEKLAESAHAEGMEQSRTCPFSAKLDETLHDLQSRVTAEVRARPWSALLMAGAAGLLLGVLWQRR